MAKSEASNENPVDMSALSTFRLRRYTTEVDIAGARARVNTINELLASIDGKSENVKRRDQLEELKISAEVELAGLAAQLQTLEKLIAEAHHSFELQRERSDARQAQTAARLKSEEIEVRLKKLREEFQAYAPGPCKGTIYSITWEPQKDN